MAGESKGESKLFQIMMVVITSVIAPVSVYFITHSIQASADTIPATSTLSSPASSMTTALPPRIATVTQTVTTTKTVTETITAQKTATSVKTAMPAVQNPRGVLPAGSLAVVNGMTVAVVTDAVQIQDRNVGIQIHIHNQSSKPQTFTYRVQSIIVKDASGHGIEVINGDKRNACTKKDLGAERKIALKPDQEIILESVEADTDLNWCGPEDDLVLPLYRVSAKEMPDSAVVQFNNFGPFNGFGMKVDLQVSAANP